MFAGAGDSKVNDSESVGSLLALAVCGCYEPIVQNQSNRTANSVDKKLSHALIRFTKRCLYPPNLECLPLETSRRPMVELVRMNGKRAFVPGRY